MTLHGRRAFGFVLTLACAGLICGCQRKPDFDERYEAASQHIEDSAKAIDARIAATQGAPTDAPLRSAR